MKLRRKRLPGYRALWVSPDNGMSLQDTPDEPGLAYAEFAHWLAADGNPDASPDEYHVLWSLKVFADEFDNTLTKRERKRLDQVRMNLEDSLLCM